MRNNILVLIDNTKHLMARFITDGVTDIITYAPEITFNQEEVEMFRTRPEIFKQANGL